MAGPSALFLAHLRAPARAGRLPVDRPAVQRIVVGEARAAGSERRVRIALAVESDRVADARFQAFGCSATLVCASFVADAAAGARLDRLSELGPEEVVRALELPPEKTAAAELALEALASALSEAATRDSG